MKSEQSSVIVRSVKVMNLTFDKLEDVVGIDEIEWLKNIGGKHCFICWKITTIVLTRTNQKKLPVYSFSRVHSSDPSKLYGDPLHNQYYS